MNIDVVKVGYLETNCYILEKNNNILLIDPGDESYKIIDKVRDKKLLAILITHNHFDHVGALKEILNYYNIQVFDKDNLSKGLNNIGLFNFEVMYNPGHTKDSISFIFDNIMFSGDFIFEGTIGRCDLGGDFNIMTDSIQRLLKSNKNYIIYPGHGNSTSLDKERNNLESWLK